MKSSGPEGASLFSGGFCGIFVGLDWLILLLWLHFPANIAKMPVLCENVPENLQSLFTVVVNP